ncbi:MAG: hypothetical protein LBT91_02575 [Bifidobacteriaceae bacterium]|jgi:glutaredoxin|nr:hypothetical protein [Bifidobacteriaceae bacterium]
MIKIYTRQKCLSCVAVKTYLLKKDIKFDELPITDEVIELYKDKADVLPIITVDDVYFSHGFDSEKLGELK